MAKKPFSSYYPILLSKVICSECGTTTDCADGELCNFDYGDDGGFCEPCPGETEQACVDSGYHTDLGTAECKSVCVVWKRTRDACWYPCNKIGGKCAWCGESGFCCRKGVPGNPVPSHWNGNCPINAIKAAKIYHHGCVSPKV